MATGSVSPKTGKVVDIPDQTVTIGTATDGNTGTTVSVPFTVGSVATGGPVNYFTATSTPSSLTANGSASPITVSGLTTGTAYTFKVKAGNATGYSSAGESAASNSVTPELAGAFESIATFSGSSVSSVTFSSIPATYKSLQIRYMGRVTYNGGGGVYNASIILNSDTGSNYTWHAIRGTGSNAVGYGSTYTTQLTVDTVFPDAAILASTFGVAITDIHDYASTTKTKTIRTMSGYDTNSAGNMWLQSSLWNSTAAITSIQISNNAGSNFATGSTFALYGIKGS